jgi:dipeptidyl aminopeptidase/acylaminoacyl peptidase
MRHSIKLLTLKKSGLWLPGLLVLVMGIIFVPIAAAQGNDVMILTVVAPALNVRSGPGSTYPALAQLTEGDTLAVVGHDPASHWWQVQLLNGQTGWVSGGPANVSVIPELATTVPKEAVSTQLQAPPPPAPISGSLVFQTAAGGPIYAINADGSNLHYLTTGMDPALSADGQWVAFTRWETSQDGALGSVWVIKVDGTGERVIHQNVFNPRSPTWSNDGTKIVISMQHGGRLDYVHDCSTQRPSQGAIDIRVKRIDRGKIEFCYTLLPDPHWSLRLINVATGQYEDLPSDTYSRSPIWDPHNVQHLVYHGEFGLVSLDLANNKSSVLTDDLDDHSPVFSPDGRRIAVSYHQDNHWEVHVLNADCASPPEGCGSGPVRLTQTSYETLMQQELNGETPHSYNNVAPTWSPDGSQIAFLTDRTGRWEIWVMNAECASPPEGCGSNQRPLFSDEINDQLQITYNFMDERMLSWR